MKFILGPIFLILVPTLSCGFSILQQRDRRAAPAPQAATPAAANRTTTTATGAQNIQAGGAPETVDDIQFDLPDIVVTYPYQNKSVTLEAYKVRSSPSDSRPKWVSIGYPQVSVPNDDRSQIFAFTDEYITVEIILLNDQQRRTLYNSAKTQYPNNDVLEDNITPLPLVQFTCTISFYLNGTNYNIRGGVYDVHRNPLLLRFPYQEGNDKRAAFKRRLAQNNQPLYFECELAATGKQEKINTLKITAQQLQQIGLADSLLGPADERFVTRKQVTDVTQNVQSKLQIEETYELENEDFSSDLINKILDSSKAVFEPVPIDQALSQLSKYGLKMDGRDLSPNEIKKELSNVFEVKSQNSKDHLVVKNDNSNAGKDTLDVSGGAGASGSAFFGMFSGSASLDFATKKSNEWATSSSSFNDQLKELNQSQKN